MAVSNSKVPLLRTENLALHFDGGQTHALKDVSLAIDEGEFVAIVGPSGCGKSSLLNLIGSLDAPSAGNLYFRGQAYSGAKDKSLFRRRHFGFIFQSFNLIPTLSALNNVLVPTVGTPGAPRQHAARGRELLLSLGLGQRLHHCPAALSGGERQRVAIARALINDPDVLLADEPTGSLDSTNAVQVLDLIAKLRTERQLAVVMVTHDAQVSARADRIITMRDGLVAHDSGKPKP